MPRIIFTITEQMEADLKAEAEKRGATLSNLARLYIAQGLIADNGKTIESYVVGWGGKRTPKKDKE